MVALQAVELRQLNLFERRVISPGDLSCDSPSQKAWSGRSHNLDRRNLMSVRFVCWTSWNFGCRRFFVYSSYILNISMYNRKWMNMVRFVSPSTPKISTIPAGTRTGPADTEDIGSLRRHSILLLSKVQWAEKEYELENTIDLLYPLVI